MKLAVAASLVIHLAGLAAIPTHARDDASSIPAPAAAWHSAAVDSSPCKCDLEVDADNSRGDTALMLVGH